jgi:hypothetical protein
MGTSEDGSDDAAAFNPCLLVGGKEVVAKCGPQDPSDRPRA